MLFNKDSKQYYNEKFEYLFNNLKISNYPISTVAKNQFNPRVFAKTISEEDILASPIVTSYSHGSEVAREFCHSKQSFELNGEYYDDFLKICYKISTLKEFKKILSLDFIKTTSFEWIQEKSTSSKILDFTEYFENKVKENVNEYKIWFPISYFCIENNFTFGEISFEEITDELLDSWYTVNNNDEKIIKQMKLASEKDKKILKGYAAGVIKIQAEPILAKSISKEKLDTTLSILRIFEGIVAQPDKVSMCVPKGQENTQSLLTYTTDLHNALLNKQDSSIFSHPPFFILNKEKLSEIKKFTGFKIIDKILKNDNLSAFQETCFNSFIIYSKNSLKIDISDKIIYVLVSLESLLLKSQGEPIQQNVGERFAFYSKQTPKERQEIVTMFKEIYNLRSKFIHHGKEIEHMDIISEFFKSTFYFFIKLMCDLEKFDTKDSFIKHLDEIKFS